MKKYFISRELDFVMIFVLIFDVFLFGYMVIAQFFQENFRIISVIIILVIALISITIILFIIFVYCFHYVYIEDNNIFYKTIFNKKKIYLLDEKLVCMKKYDFIPNLRPHPKEIVDLESNSIEIKIPLHIYKRIKEDYSQLPDV